MKNFIQVTNRSGSTVLLNVNHIAAVYFIDGLHDCRAQIVMVGGLTYEVKEDREYIQRMMATAVMDLE